MQKAMRASEHPVQFWGDLARSLGSASESRGDVLCSSSAVPDGAEHVGGTGGIANKAKRVVLLVMVYSHHSHGLINTR